MWCIIAPGLCQWTLYGGRPFLTFCWCFLDFMLIFECRNRLLILYLLCDPFCMVSFHTNPWEVMFFHIIEYFIMTTSWFCTQAPWFTNQVNLNNLAFKLRFILKLRITLITEREPSMVCYIKYTVTVTALKRRGLSK